MSVVQTDLTKNDVSGSSDTGVDDVFEVGMEC